MPDTPTSASSPPKGLSSSPSIFAYQTRLLDRTSSVSTVTRSPHSAASSSLSSLADSSPSSTPIRRNVAKMAAGLDGLSGADVNRSPSKIGKGHAGSKSVDLVRNQWEAKINDAAGPAKTPRAIKRSTFMSPPSTSASSLSSEPTSMLPPASVEPIKRYTTSLSRGTSIDTVHTESKRPGIPPPIQSDALPAFEPPPSPALSSSSSRVRPASAASYTSILSPSSTGSSSVASGRSQAVEDTLAQARANALKRLEARKKAQAAASGSEPEIPTEEATTIKATPVPAPMPVEILTTPSTPQRPPVEVKKASPFDHLFSPPSASDYTPVKETPKSHSYRNPTSPTPPSAMSRYVPSGLSVEPSASGSGGKDKYGSISRTDRRRLGRHLPRIASGGEGWDEPPEPLGSTRRVPSTLGRSAAPPSPTKDKAPPLKKIEVLAPSFQENQPPSPVTATPKRKSAYMASISKEKIGSVLQSPRHEVQGAEMKGLMSAVGSLPARGTSKDDGEGVTGMSNRLRLSRAVLPPSASSASVAPAPLPSRRLIQTNWMDRQRHALAAYEYLCHVGEALQWIEGCLDEEVGFGVVEMEDGLQDGVVLAKLARCFMGDQVVKSIWTESKHRYKQTDNINHFLKFVRSVGMPETFTFELTDLYNKRNIPKVIFCLHVLSHLLARLGKAERIGNLVGQFEFTDEQLAATQKGLQGVAMPNFGDAKATLAKEASWEPEEPEETEDEKRDRMLLECEGSIRSLQRHLRGRLARKQVSRIHAQLELAEPIIVRFQSHARAALCRRSLLSEHEERIKLGSWATRVQAAARASLARKRMDHRTRQVQQVERYVLGLQAHARGVIVRSRKGKEVNELDSARRSIVGLQSLIRGKMARQAQKSVKTTLVRPEIAQSVTSLQSVLRGRLHRQAEAKRRERLSAQGVTYTALQSHLRGALVRRSRKAEEQRMDDASDVIVAIQAVCRGVLSRRKKQALVKAVQVAMPSLSSLQAYARGRLAQQNHQTMQKALAKVEVAGSVGGLQAFLRTKLAKRQTMEQKKKLEFVSPDVIGFQAQARGYLARQDYNEWREYLHDPHTQGALVFLQSLIRGFLSRRQLWLRTSHYYHNVDKIVKVQSLWRGRVQRRMYDKLLTGIDVDVPAVQNYMHLLNDTESDFNDQMRTETLRREVTELVRENQTLETEVQDLETKIALIVKNKMTFEELAKAKRRQGNLEGKNDSFVISGSHDPFSGAHLDRASQRKLELFEHLFFTLQTKPDYLARLVRALERGEDEKDTRTVEGVLLTLFGYGHERREEYLFNKLVQLSTHTEVLLSKSIPHLINGRFFLQSLATAYLKPVLAPFLQEVLTMHVMRVNEAVELDLCTDPLEIYQRLINEEESHTGVPSQKPRDRDADQVLQTDADARAHYIRHLQELRFLTAELLRALYACTPGLPYTVRYLAREALLALRVKYPDALDEDLTPAVARTFILPFILPALIAPETWGITDQPIGPNERRNLAAIANLVGYIAYPDADMASPMTKPGDRFVRVPLQEYIRTESAAFRDWVMDVASVEPLESYFEAHELFESTHEAKPILITRREIYGMLSVLMKNIPVLTGNKPKDPIALLLEELEGPPIEYDAKTTVSLRLTNRLAELEPGDPESQTKEDFVQAKRHVLAVLRVQSGRTLYDVLVSRPEETDEQRWLEEVYRDMAVEQARAAKHGIPQPPAEAGYQIESIRSLPFHEVKSRAIEFCMKLERAGKISRKDAYQGLLVSIASDIRQKHHLRKMLRQSLAAMIKAHEDMSSKKNGFEESIKSYHTFIDSSMANLQKGKKRPIFMSKQYRHQKYEEKQGKRAQFGSYKYTAQDLYEKGILLGISQFSPRQYDKIHIIIASNEVGVFSLEMSAPQSQFAEPTIGHEEVRMEDLLQAQFDNELNLLLFDGMATFSINMLIHQINKNIEAERPEFDASYKPHYTRVPDVDFRPGGGLNNLPYSEDFRPENAAWRGIDPKDFQRSEVYKLMISAITPRPIALLSTISKDGTCNLAPYSLFNMVCADPPTIMVSIQANPNTPSKLKDSALNIRDVKEFCVSIISEPFLEASHMTSMDLPPDMDEWRLSGLTKRSSELVNPPHVAESAFSMECTLDHWHQCKTDEGIVNNTVVFGRIRRFHAKEFVIDPSDPMKIMPEKLRPVARLGGLSYTRSLQFCDMLRPAWEDHKDDEATVEALSRL